MRPRLGVLALTVFLIAALSACGSKAPQDAGSSTSASSAKSTCQLASDYAYYVSYMGGKYGTIDDGAAGKALYQSIDRTLNGLQRKLPGKYSGYATDLLSVIQWSERALGKVDYKSSKISPQLAHAEQMQLEQTGSEKRELQRYMIRTCGKTAGFGKRPSDAPSTLPVHPTGKQS